MSKTTLDNLIFSYRPIDFSFPGTTEELRITSDTLEEQYRLARNARFLEKAVINPFEESLLRSNEKELNLDGSKAIRVETSQSVGSISWSKVYNELSSFLEIRKIDGVEDLHEETKYIEGIGYCIELVALEAEIERLESKFTSDPESRPRIVWPLIEETEKYPTHLDISETVYSRITRKNGRTVLTAKRFNKGIQENVITPTENELKRWFEAKTGYSKQNLPEKEPGHTEKTARVSSGNYLQVQLTRVETPEYKQIILNLMSELEKIKDEIPTQEIKHTTHTQGREAIDYVSVESALKYLSRKSMEDRGLIRVSGRYNITPKP